MGGTPRKRRPSRFPAYATRHPPSARVRDPGGRHRRRRPRPRRRARGPVRHRLRAHRPDRPLERPGTPDAGRQLPVAPGGPVPRRAEGGRAGLGRAPAAREPHHQSRPAARLCLPGDRQRARRQGTSARLQPSPPEGRPELPRQVHPPLPPRRERVPVLRQLRGGRALVRDRLARAGCAGRADARVRELHVHQGQPGGRGPEDALGHVRGGHRRRVAQGHPPAHGRGALRGRRCHHRACGRPLPPGPRHVSALARVPDHPGIPGQDPGRAAGRPLVSGRRGRARSLHRPEGPLEQAQAGPPLPGRPPGRRRPETP